MSTRPILLKNICKEAEWGGNNVTNMFGIISPYEKTSEVWTVSAHEKGETLIVFPEERNRYIELSMLYDVDQFKQIFGFNCKKYERFPLLAKWIDANDNLSVQVHPNDEYALENYNSFGKTEAWYIVSAKEGAQIVYGLKPGTTREVFEDALKQNQIKEILNFVPVKAGEIYYIPAGMVHALLKGVIVYEIQQSSDITYRIYDWDRNDPNRKLRIEKALEVIDFEKNDEYINANMKIKNSNKFKGQYFEFSVLKTESFSKIYLSEKSFKLCSVLDGTIDIKHPCSDMAQRVKAGNSFILSASFMRMPYSIRGKSTILISTVI